MTLSELAVDLKLNADQFLAGVESAMTTWESFGGGLLKVGAAMSAAVTLPLVGLGQAAMKMGTQLQQAEIAFGTMLGSAELAGAYLEELKEFAAKTPFEFSELVPAAKRLMALGFAAEETIPMLKALGNAAAGLGGGAALIQRLGLALGQMRAKAKVSAEEMRQLAEAGIPAWEMLAKAMGKTTAELMKLSEKGQVSAAAAIPILIQGMNEKFGGLMEGFMETAMGQYSNVKDQLGFVLADIGKALLPIAALLIEKFALPAVSALRDLANWFSKLSDSSKFLIIAFAAVAAAIGPMTVALGAFGYMYAPLIAGAARVAAILIPVFTNVALAISTGMTGALVGFEATLLSFAGVAVPAIAAIGAAFLLWQIPAFRKMMEDTWTEMKKFWTDTIQPFIGAVLDVGKAFLQAGGELAQSGLTAVLDTLRQAMNSTAVKEFGDSLRSLAQAYKDLYGALGPILELLRPVVELFGKWAVVSVGGQIQAGLWAIETGLSNAAKALEFFITMVSAQLTAALAVGKQGLDNIASTLNFMKPIVDSVVGAFQGLVKYLSEKFPFLVTLANLLGDAYDGLKSKITSFVDKATSGHKTAATAVSAGLDQMTAAFKDSEKEYANAVKALSEFDKATGKALGTQEAAVAADMKMQQAKAALVAQMEKEGVGVKTLYDATIKAQSAYSSATVALETLKATHGKGAESAKALAAAQVAVGQAHQGVIKAQLALQQSGARLGLTLADIKKQYDKVIPAAKTLEDQEKALKEAVKSAQVALDIAVRSADKSVGAYDGSAESAERLANATGATRKALEASKASYDRVVAATVSLQAAQDKLNPEKYAERYQKGTDIKVKADEDWVKSSLAVLVADAKRKAESIKTNLDMENSITHLALVFGKANEAIRNAGLQQVEITATLPKQLPAAINDVLKRQADLQGAYKATGAVSVEELRRQADAAKQAYDTIAQEYERGAGRRRVTEYDLLQQTKLYLEAEVEYRRKAGDAGVKAYEDALNKVDERLKRFGEKQKTFWTELGQAIQGIMMNWAADIGRGLWDTLLGKSRKDFNKGLDQQATDLNKSLAERTSDWEAYQVEIAARQTEAQQKYEDTLAEEGTALQASLDDRVQDYVDAEAETASKLEEVRAEYAKNLSDELADLASSLEERRVEYEDYVADINTRLAETRQEHVDQLAGQLSDLQSSLGDQLRSYNEYVASVNKKLSRIGEDYAESIDDETKQTKAGIDDKQQEYKRDEEDILQKIARLKKAGKKESDEEVQDLRKSLQRKAEDLDEYVREQTAALDEYTNDAKRRLDRETSDLAESLAERTAEWTRYQAENKKKRDDYVLQNAADLAKDEADLARSLADRAADWVKYQADNAKAVEEAYVKYAEGLAKEERNLAESLAKRAKSLDDYIVEANKKWEKIQAAALATLQREEADLAASLDAQRVEYDKYVSDTAARLEELKGLYKSAWDDIKDMMVGAFEQAGSALMTFVTTYLMGRLLDALTKGSLVDAIAGIGKKLADIFTGGGGGSIIPSLPGVTPPTPNIPSSAPPFPGGGGAGMAGAASSSAAAWVGVAATAIGAAITAIGQARMEGTLNAIEKEARYAQIHLYYILEKINNYLPILYDIHGYLYGVQQPALVEMLDHFDDLSDSLKTKTTEGLVRTTASWLEIISGDLWSFWQDATKWFADGMKVVDSSTSAVAAPATISAPDLATRIAEANRRLSEAQTKFTASTIADELSAALAQFAVLPIGADIAELERTAATLEITIAGLTAELAEQSTSATSEELSAQLAEEIRKLGNARSELSKATLASALASALGSVQQAIQQSVAGLAHVIGSKPGEFEASQKPLKDLTELIGEAKEVGVLSEDQFKLLIYTLSQAAKSGTAEPWSRVFNDAITELQGVGPTVDQLAKTVADLEASVASLTAQLNVPTSSDRNIAEELAAAIKKLETAQTALAAAVENATSGYTEEALGNLAAAIQNADKTGVLTPRQLMILNDALKSLTVGDARGVAAVNDLIAELRATDSSTSDLADTIRDLEHTVVDLTAQLSAPSAAPAAPPAAATPPRSLLGNLLDTVNQTLRAVVVPKPNLPSMADLADWLKGLQSAMANALSGVDPHNPQGKAMKAERDRLAAEIAALTAANQPVSDEKRRRLEELSANQIVTTQEAYLRNAGAAYQSWLRDMTTRTSGMLDQWTAYEASLKAVADLGKTTGDLSRIVPGMVNPLPGGAAPGQESVVPVVIQELRVPVIINGREVGNAVIHDLALQGVRM